MKKIVALLLINCTIITLYPSQPSGYSPKRPMQPVPNSSKDIVRLAHNFNHLQVISLLSKCDTSNPLVSYDIEHGKERESCFFPKLLAKAMKSNDSNYFTAEIKKIIEKIGFDQISPEQGIVEIQDILNEFWSER